MPATRRDRRVDSRSAKLLRLTPSRIDEARTRSRINTCSIRADNAEQRI